MGYLQIKVARFLDEVEPFREAWDQLVMESVQNIPMLSWTWVSSFFEHCLGPNESWICLLAFDSALLVGVLPLIVRPKCCLNRFYHALYAPNDLHTISVDFLAARGHECKVITAFLSSLSTVVPGWFGLSLTRLPDASPALELSENHPPHVLVAKEFAEWGSWVKIEKTFADFQTGLEKKHYKNLTRIKKKLSCLPGVETQVIPSRLANIQNLQDFTDLEASGWKGRNGTAIKQNAELFAFYRTLTQKLAARGWLEWHFLKAGGRMIAGHLAVRLKRTVVLLKIAYDEAYKEYAPGFLLGMNIIERAFQSGDTDEINYLSGMPMHRRWRLRERSNYNLYIFPKQPLPALLGFAPVRIMTSLEQMARNASQRLSGLKPLVRTIKKMLRNPQ